MFDHKNQLSQLFSKIALKIWHHVKEKSITLRCNMSLEVFVIIQDCHHKNKHETEKKFRNCTIFDYSYILSSIKSPEVNNIQKAQRSVCILGTFIFLL